MDAYSMRPGRCSASHLPCKSHYRPKNESSAMVREQVHTSANCPPRGFRTHTQDMPWKHLGCISSYLTKDHQTLVASREGGWMSFRHRDHPTLVPWGQIKQIKTPRALQRVHFSWLIAAHLSFLLTYGFFAAIRSASSVGANSQGGDGHIRL